MEAAVATTSSPRRSRGKRDGLARFFSRSTLMPSPLAPRSSLFRLPPHLSFSTLVREPLVTRLSPNVSRFSSFFFHRSVVHDIRLFLRSFLPFEPPSGFVNPFLPVATRKYAYPRWVRSSVRVARRVRTHGESWFASRPVGLGGRGSGQLRRIGEYSG